MEICYVKEFLVRRVIDTKYGSIFGWGSGGGVGVLIVCRGLYGVCLWKYILGRGGMSFTVLSSLRWGMALLLNFGMILCVRDFPWKISFHNYTILLMISTLQWLSCYHC